MERLPMTAAGYARLEQELKELKSTARPAVIQAISTAREHGDLSENAEYHAAKEQQSHIEGRIAELQDKLGRAEVIDVSSISGRQIKFGATILLADEDTDEETSYQIVGEDESNIEEGRLSISAPLARALIGKEQGDSIEVMTPGGSKAYEVIDVSYVG
ncbi:transcription elongation factor GreA [Sneathiella sp. CAU 1612]|uniref:Transcription elongation factor GreA n=1 Tax=Sneathiella sedimenti TaxID=2816034 RepID=A0ABS3F3M6_9PROT|nr:transcription elongation factor GreA [Sneathiella sedimenti]MBO0333103.1 transcription elongation factor GreA [Sneathiella sedimenti]